MTNINTYSELIFFIKNYFYQGIDLEGMEYMFQNYYVKNIQKDRIKKLKQELELIDLDNDDEFYELKKAFLKYGSKKYKRDNLKEIICIIKHLLYKY